MNVKRYTEHLVFLVVYILIISILITPSFGFDQPNQKITQIQNFPSGVTFYGIAWNQRDYSYAIAVGNDTSNTAVIYRYWSSNGSWNPLWVGGVGEVLYDVVYQTFAWNDTFIAVGDNGGESCAYVIYDAIKSPKIIYLGSPPPGLGFTAACFDKYRGSEGTLIAVGTPYDNVNSIIAWHDMTANPDDWGSVMLPKGEILKDVTITYDSGTSIIVAVGYNVSTGSAVAYAFNYEKVYGLNVPPLAKKFNAIDWKPNGGYGIVVGEDVAGNGKAWRIENVREADYISYYNATVGSESLKFAYYNGFEWKTTTVDSTEYAGYYTSIALDHRGRPHISYWHGGNTHLWHAYYAGGSWHLEEVDASGNVGQYSSIAIDSKDRIHISYYDTTNSELKYAYYDGTSWTITNIDASGGYTSIAVDSNDKAHISYWDETNDALRYATNAGGTWQTEIVDSSFGVGKYSSIAIDSFDNPHISYTDTNTGGLKYAYKNAGTWNTEYVVSGSLGQYTSLALDSNDSPHISFIDNGLKYTEKTSGTWSTPTLLDGNADLCTSIELGVNGDPRISYYDSTNQDLMFIHFDRGSNTWYTERVDSFGDVGKYCSLAVGMIATYSPMRTPDASPILRAVDWEEGGNGAIIVGDRGTVYVHYTGDMTLYNWTDPGITYDFKGVGVKPASSPGYGIATSNSAGAIISYQILDTGTQIGVRAIKPHINEMRLEDKNGFNVSNRQVDVGTYYYFFINGSYSEGWEKVAIDIYAWYDDNESAQYNSTPGANLNLHLHYEPDTTDPYNNSGTWKLLWPDPSNPTITLGKCIQQVVDNPAGGTIGQNDGQDFYLLWANITFHEQVRYAPGDGTWDFSGNQSDPGASFNDPNSWNFNITIRDVTNNANVTKYDEFGIYAYTEITASNNPTGAGAPGNTIYLSPSSHLGIRSNRDYFVTVNITDLKNATGNRIIPRTYVEVFNPTASNNASASYSYTWRAFDATHPIYVWGNNETGEILQPLDYGTCSAGDSYGYDVSLTYTEVQWRITIPPTTPEDEYIAVVSFEISY